MPKRRTILLAAAASVLTGTGLVGVGLSRQGDEANDPSRPLDTTPNPEGGSQPSDSGQAVSPTTSDSQLPSQASSQSEPTPEQTSKPSTAPAKPDVLFGKDNQEKLRAYSKIPATNGKGWYDPENVSVNAQGQLVVAVRRAALGEKPPSGVKSLDQFVGGVAYFPWPKADTNPHYGSYDVQFHLPVVSGADGQPMRACNVVLMLWPKDNNWSHVEYDGLEVSAPNRSVGEGNVHVGSKSSITATKANLKPGWNKASILWTPDTVSYTVNGKRTLHITSDDHPGAISDKPHDLIIQADFASLSQGAALLPEVRTPVAVYDRVEFTPLTRILTQTASLHTSLHTSGPASL